MSFRPEIKKKVNQALSTSGSIKWLLPLNCNYSYHVPIEVTIFINGSIDQEAKELQQQIKYGQEDL